MERFVLGVDAAWTATEPSGIALLASDVGSRPRIVRAGRSYEEFNLVGRPNWHEGVRGTFPDFPSIISTCKALDSEIGTVALDIPLSPFPNLGRREADNAISRQYGRLGAGTHSPSPTRPGVVASSIFDQLASCGFQWPRTENLTERSFIEVYPHVAIIELFGYQYRFPYKVGKRRRYWPDLSPKERLMRIVHNLLELRSDLSDEISNVDEFLPDIDSNGDCAVRFLKGYEDLLDALLSAMVGLRFSEGRAVPFGNEAGIIWVPKGKESDGEDA